MERKTHTKTNHLPSPDGEQPVPTCHWGLRWMRSQPDRGEDGVKKSPMSIFPGKSSPEDAWPYQAIFLSSSMCISLLPTRFSTSQRQWWSVPGFSACWTISTLLARIWISSWLCQASLIFTQCSSLPLCKVWCFPRVFQCFGGARLWPERNHCRKKQKEPRAIAHLLLGCIQSSCHEGIKALGKALKRKHSGCFEEDKPIFCNWFSTSCCPGSVICLSLAILLSLPSLQNNQ